MNYKSSNSFHKIQLFLIIFFYFLLPTNCQVKKEIKNLLILNGTLDLRNSDFQKLKYFELNGEWNFYWMEFIKKKDLPSENKKNISVPSQWQDKGYTEKGYATYHLDILLPKQSPDLALDIRSVACAYEVYVNGNFVGKQGEIGENEILSVPYLRHAIYDIDPVFLASNREKIDLRLYVSNYHYFKGGLWDTISIGSAKEVRKLEKNKFVLDIVVLSCLLLMGVYHFGLYLTRSSDKSPLYFAIFVFIVALRTASINDRLIMDLFPKLNFLFVNKIEYLTVYLSGTVFLKFVESLFPEDSHPNWSKWINLFFLPPSLLVIFFPMYVFGQAVTIVEFGIFIEIVYVGNMLRKSLRAKRVGAKLFISGFIILAISAIHDILKGKEVVYTPYALGYGLTTFIIFQAAILTRKYAAAFIKSEELTKELTIFSKELEEKVVARTSELQSTLEKVKELKLQQDGDYFLTSQLLKPLNSNKVESRYVNIEFFTSQKKKFQFREWQEEIGGDLCMSNHIFLKGKRYIVFVNADAMGKSLQGASGALVFGSVFESIINRNQISPNMENLFPEKWMKEAFVELHHVFETFDGSMLVSLVMGLIEEETGILYMINADHPSTILYRDGKASFIGYEKKFRKLGTLGANEFIHIFTTILLPGDVLFLGSDGRDDLLIKTDEGSIINENETLILNHVESSNADLNLLFKKITSVGIQYDDLTLIKVSFSLVEKENQDVKNPRDPQFYADNSDFISKKQFQTFLKNKEFNKAIEISNQMKNTFEADTELLFQVSYAYKKVGNYLSSYEYSERVRLRDPGHIRNLINLSDILNMTGNRESALEILKKILEMNPEDPIAKKRLKSLL